MKYRVTILLSLLVVSLILLGSVHSLRASDSRGDKQFTFTTDGRGGFPSLSPDSPAAKLKEEHRAGSALPPQSSSMGNALDPDALSTSTQQAGQVGDSTRGREARLQLGEEDEPLSRQQGIDELRLQNQSAGQTSNVPGTTSTSPNGTGNIYGTKGIPLIPNELRTRP